MPPEPRAGGPRPRSTRRTHPSSRSPVRCDDIFGSSVGVSGDWITVGAPEADGNDLDSGSAHAVAKGAGWSGCVVVTHDLIGSDVVGDDRFGQSIAIDGTRIVVGATQHDQPGAGQAGQAYVFELVGATWVETHWLRAPDPCPGDTFGYEPAIDGTSVLVGAIVDDEAGADTGAAYFGELNSLIHAFCFCDTGFCTNGAPCNNPDPDAGCASSLGQGSLLERLDGSTSVTLDDLELQASNVPPNQFGILFMGGGSAPPMPFGEGLICVTPGPASFCRFDVQNSGAQGTFTIGPGIVALSGSIGPSCGIDPGENWYFQAWFREPAPTCAGFNLSNALSVCFVP